MRLLLLLAAFVAQAYAQPAWFGECVGFGCYPTQNYRHQPCVVYEFTQAALQACVRKAEFVHVTFHRSGTIYIAERLPTFANLIIDGSGHRITFTGREIFLGHNSIVHRITFDTGSYEPVSVQKNNIWIHKCSFRNYQVGLMDITRSANAVTVSYCEFRDQILTLLISADNNDIVDRVTLHHNYFYNCHSRLPRIRHAFVHIYNNVFEDWTDYAIAASMRARALIENNWFSSKSNPQNTMWNKAGTDPENGFIRAGGNYYGPGCREASYYPQNVPNPSYGYQLERADNNLYDKIRREAGNK